MMNLKPKHKSFYLAVVAVVFAVVVVILGAFTRLVDAGLGCPDWPTCYGHLLWPNTEAEVAQANAYFAETPVEHDKTWPEQVHRIFASTLGLLVLALFAAAVKGRDPGRRWLLPAGLLVVLVLATVARIALGDSMDVYVGGLALFYLLLMLLPEPGAKHYQRPFKLPALLAGLVILQGLFGMWTVTLKLWPQVVTAHLLGGFTTLSLLLLLCLRLYSPQWLSPAAERLWALKPYALVGMALVFGQIALGGWLSANYAAFACPDLPTCQGSWWPTMDLAQGFNLTQPVGPNYLGGVMDNEARVGIHMAHRIGALVVSAYLIGLILVLSAAHKGWAVALGAVLALQVGLGLSNVIWFIPLPVAVAHNAGGALLLLTMVALVYYLANVRQR